MILSDSSIRERIKKEDLIIDPFCDSSVQPASYDIHLHPGILKMVRPEEIDDIPSRFNEDELAQKAAFKKYEIKDNEVFQLQPYEFVLGSTDEWVQIPDDIAARLCGRSTVGRSGLIVHLTAGFIDPGFVGNITLEMVNLSPIPINLEKKMRLAQLVFHPLDEDAETPYGDREDSQYHGQNGPTPGSLTENIFEGGVEQ